jgi:hypothetical protein
VQTDSWPRQACRQRWRDRLLGRLFHADESAANLRKTAKSGNTGQIEKFRVFSLTKSIHTN